MCDIALKAWKAGRAALAAAPVQAQEPRKPTDLSSRLRSYIDQNLVPYPIDVLAAADEIERYYAGMLNWKETAEAKDRAPVQPLTVPHGWKLMPVRMAPEMKSILKEAAPKWNAESIYGNLLEAAPAAPAAQGDAKDACAEMRALCSACGGTGDVHGLDGEWRGQCTCVHAWQQRAEKAEDQVTELEAQLARRRTPLSPETQQAIAAACATGQSIAATPGGLVFMNDGAEPDYSKLDCPACGGSGHAADVPAGSGP